MVAGAVATGSGSGATVTIRVTPQPAKISGKAKRMVECFILFEVFCFNKMQLGFPNCVIAHIWSMHSYCGA